VRDIIRVPPATVTVFVDDRPAVNADTLVASEDTPVTRRIGTAMN
jgi:hypothetical protein